MASGAEDAVRGQRHALEQHAAVEVAALRDVEEAVRGHVETGLGQSGLAHPEHVEAFDAPVRLDEHVAVGVVADEVDGGLPAEDRPGHHLERLDDEADRVARPPVVEDRQQEIGARRRPEPLLHRGDRLVGLVREQVGDGAGTQRGQVLVHRDRVATKLHDGEDVDREPGRPQLGDPGHDPVVTAAAAVVDAEHVVHRRRTVEAHTHRHAVVGEHLCPPVVDERAVGLHRDPYGPDRAQLRAQPGAPPGEPVTAEEGGFATMEHHVDLVLTDQTAVLGDARDGGLEDLLRHQSRLVTPRLVALLVDVAVRAGQVAARHHLQGELQPWLDHPTPTFVAEMMRSSPVAESWPSTS